MSDSEFYMGEVARLSKVLSNAKRESPNGATVRAIEHALAGATQRYTNPFKINKYQQ